MLTTTYNLTSRPTFGDGSPRKKSMKLTRKISIIAGIISAAIIAITDIGHSLGWEYAQVFGEIGMHIIAFVNVAFAAFTGVKDHQEKKGK